MTISRDSWSKFLTEHDAFSLKFYDELLMLLYVIHPQLCCVTTALPIRATPYIAALRCIGSEGVDVRCQRTRLCMTSHRSCQNAHYYQSV